MKVTRDTRQRAPLVAGMPVDVMEAVREPVSLYGDEKHLWIGTTRGAFMFDGVRVVSVDALAPLRDAGVWDIAGSKGRGLWFATSNGLYLLRDGELTAHATGSVRSVRVIDDDGDDAGQVWCAVDGGGVVTLRVSDDYGIIKSAFDVEQGLPSQNAFVVLPVPATETHAHTILIGTNQGLVRYRTSRIAPRPAWTRIGTRPLFATTMNNLPPLHLAYPQRDVHVEVAGISSRTFPQKYHYGFILRDATNRILKRQLSSNAAFITTDLAPGDYQLTAHIFGIDLTQSDALTYNFTIETAPFPKTTLALSVLLALALGTLWWGARQNMHLRRAGGELFRVNRELTGARLALANEAESERRRIARDLHDQTLADLRRLLLRCDAGNNQTSEADSLRHDIEAVSIEVRRICEDLSPSVLENVGLAAALEWGLVEACAQLPASERFAYEFVCDENLDERLRLPVSVQIQLYRIVQEALNNISRHAGANFVKLTVTLAPDGALHLTLENDGMSFNPATKKRGRGIVNMHARASLVAARLEWTIGEDGDGTRLMLRVPDLESEPPAVAGG